MQYVRQYSTYSDPTCIVSNISSIADSTTKLAMPQIGVSLIVWPRQSPIVSYGARTYKKNKMFFQFLFWCRNCYDDNNVWKVVIIMKILRRWKYLIKRKIKIKMMTTNATAMIIKWLENDEEARQVCESR